MKNPLGRPKKALKELKKLRTCRIKEVDYKLIIEFFGSLQNLIDLQIKKLKSKE